MTDPTLLPWASFSSTIVLAALTAEQRITKRDKPTAEETRRFIGASLLSGMIIIKFAGAWMGTRTGQAGDAVHHSLSTKMWSILRVRSKFFGEKCNHGFECSGRSRGAGSGGLFSGAGRESLSHHRDVQVGAAGASDGRA